MPLNPKQKLLGKIEGLKITSESFSNLQFFNNLPSKSNSNPLNFVLDLIKTTIGGSTLRNFFSDFIVNFLDDFAVQLKEQFKQLLSDLVFCNIDTLIPDKFFDEQFYSIKSVDFFRILKISPNSEEGQFYYQNYPNDLNVFLYNCVINPSTYFNWIGLLDIKYEDNKLYVKIDQQYKGKTIHEFMNDFFFNINLFSKANVVSNLIDGLFGTISSKFRRPTKLIEFDQKLDIIVSKIIEADINEINPDYFTFSDDELTILELRKLQIKYGKIGFEDCENIESTYNYADYVEFISSIKSKQVDLATFNIHLDTLINTVGKDLNYSDKNQFSINFFENLVKRLIKSILTSILSPKVVLFCRIFLNMAGSLDIEEDIVAFMRKYPSFIKKITKTMLDTLLNKLIEIIIKELSELILQNNIKRQSEQIQNYYLQLKSLIGF